MNEDAQFVPVSRLREAEAEIAALRERAERAEAVCQNLLKAAEMHRAWEVNSEEDFNEMYPDEEGWAHGDVDENLLQAMDDARGFLSAHDAGKEQS